jgi:hypothetical protein
MRARTTGVMAAAVISMVASAGCNDDTGKGADGHPTSALKATVPVSTPPATPPVTPPASSTKHTADDLKRALITVPPRATHSVSDSGTYDKLFGKIGLGAFITSASKLDKPQCAVVGGLEQKLFGHSPTAYVAYSQGAKVTSESLVGMNEFLAGKAAGLKTPPGCESIRFKGKIQVSVRVVSDKPAGIGKGGRIKQVDETIDGQLTHSWSVSFYGPGYLGGVGINGDHVAESEALAMARHAYQKATATLG